MNLFLIRHSIAENISVDKKDFDRELTSEGKEVIVKTSQAWKSYIEQLDVVLSSPLTRAVQTAEIISTQFQPGKNIY